MDPSCREGIDAVIVFGSAKESDFWYRVMSMDEAQICQLAQAAVDQFGSGVFWSVPGFRVTNIEAAKVAAEMLRKHGGIKGWEKSNEIEHAIDQVSNSDIETTGV